MRRWHSLMSVSGLTAAGGPQTYYPDPDAASAGGLYGASTTAGDSAVLPATSAAIVYRLTVTGNTGGGGPQIALETHAGVPIATLQISGSQISSTMDFGPAGIKLSDFRVTVTGTGVTNGQFHVVYEVVEA